MVARPEPRPLEDFSIAEPHEQYGFALEDPDQLDLFAGMDLSDAPPASRPETPQARREAPPPQARPAAPRPKPASFKPESVAQTVKRFWGYDELRPLQREAIEASLAGRDSLVVMPTGGGKSLCYQVPPVVADRLDVVVSPLIALMKDQVDGLRANGYPAAALHSMNSETERREVFEGIASGAYRLLFVSPERLALPNFIETLKRANVAAFAIDEAHCISQWGHDFRPEYRQLRQLKQHFPNASFHAYTATATPRVRQDIIAQLGLRKPDVLVGSFDRPNLSYRVTQRNDLQRQVLDVVNAHAGEAVIVYTISRKDAEGLAEGLKYRGVKAAAYHAGLDPRTRAKTQEDFAAERIDVVVATVAFGMGIDRGNVRAVVHAAMPKSIEHYQQETGRAGRDGLEAECVLFYSNADSVKWEFVMGRPSDDGPQSPEVIAAQVELLREMQRFASSSECRHAALSRYFGQEYETENCNACDVCQSPPVANEEAEPIARSIVEAVRGVRGSFGVGHVCDVLLGGGGEKVRSKGHDQLPEYGALRSISKTALQDAIMQLIGQRVLTRTPGDRPVLQLGPNARQFLDGEIEVKLRLPDEATVATKTRSSKVAEESWEGVDRGLFERLRTLRRIIAEERELPAFVVFGDATLRDLARIRPTTLQTMGRIPGIGERKLNELGDRFITEIRDHCKDRGLDTDLPLSTKPYMAPKTKQTSRAAYPYFDRGAPAIEVAEALGVTEQTALSYLEDYIGEKRPASVEAWVAPAVYRAVETTARRVGGSFLKPVFEALGGKVSYEKIRIVMKHAGLR